MKKILSPQPIALLPIIALLRIVVGSMMIYHGWEVFNATQMKEYASWDVFKKYESALSIVYIGKATELLSGLLLAFGLFTRLGAVLLIGSMCFITFVVGKGIVWYGDQHPFMFVLLGVLFFCSGSGKWSVDQQLFQEK